MRYFETWTADTWLFYGVVLGAIGLVIFTATYAGVRLARRAPSPPCESSEAAS